MREHFSQLVLWIPTPVKAEFRSKCKAEGVTMVGIIRVLIARWMKE